MNAAGAIKIADIGNYKDPAKVYEDTTVLNKALNKIEEGKAALENIYTNYIPGYSSIVININSLSSDLHFSFVESMMKSADSVKKPETNPETDGDTETVEETTAAPIEYSAVYLGEGDGVHKYYAIYPTEFIDTALSWDIDRLESNMFEQIDHVNRIIAANTGVNFYLYVGKRMQDAEYYPEIVKGEISTAPQFNYFMESIEGTKGKGYLNVDTIEARLTNVFKTDHHWSAMGAYSGYTDIINMISAVTPEISSPIQLKGLITFPDVQLRGSASRISSFHRFYEEFSVMDVDIPEGEQGARMHDSYDKYISGNFNKERFADHYELYYNKPNPIKYPSNTTGRNLLIIGDSYTWWSSWLIAANFDATYLYYPWDRKKLNYNKFIEENGITNVLLMQFSDRIIFNIYNDCPLKNIITE